MKGILVCHTFVNVNISRVLEVAATVKNRTFDIFLDVNQGRGIGTELVTICK
jgi:hypothetical protein